MAWYCPSVAPLFIRSNSFQLEAVLPTIAIATSRKAAWWSNIALLQYSWWSHLCNILSNLGDHQGLLEVVTVGGSLVMLFSMLLIAQILLHPLSELHFFVLLTFIGARFTAK